MMIGVLGKIFESYIERVIFHHGTFRNNILVSKELLSILVRERERCAIAFARSQPYHQG